ACSARNDTFLQGESVNDAARTSATAAAGTPADSWREKSRGHCKRQRRREEDYSYGESRAGANEAGSQGRLARRRRLRTEHTDHARSDATAAGHGRQAHHSGGVAGTENDFDGAAESRRQADDLARADAAQRDHAVF